MGARNKQSFLEKKSFGKLDKWISFGAPTYVIFLIFALSALMLVTLVPVSDFLRITMIIAFVSLVLFYLVFRKRPLFYEMGAIYGVLFLVIPTIVFLFFLINFVVSQPVLDKKVELSISYVKTDNYYGYVKDDVSDEIRYLMRFDAYDYVPYTTHYHIKINKGLFGYLVYKKRVFY